MKFLLYRDKIISLSKCSFHLAAPFLVKKHYETLGVKETATINEIKSAYYKLSMLYHPDKNDSNEAAQKFRDITEAYETLGNFNKKKLYDRGLTDPLGHVFQRRAKEKAKYEEYKIRIKKNEMNFEVTLTLIILIILLMGCYLIDFDENKIKKDISQNNDLEDVKKD